ncbi:MAG: hypothetical protein KIPDCIKN_01103 [Haliscomenobacter sp.]|jgi:membrane associated rhomboid family serine protease|nr:hypothetical protein [Haliscomenobacter sp.]
MPRIFSRHLINSLRFPVVLLAVLWAIQLVQMALHLELGYWGVFPRTVYGLKGIITHPFLHGSIGHLLSNTPPLLFLTAMVLYFYRRVAIPAITLIYLLTGLAVWLFGRPVFHIGASGIIYGLVAFVFWTGVFRRNLKSIALAAIVLFYYGSMFMGILPGQEGISWESHLLGAGSGILVSFWFKNRLESDELPKAKALEEETPSKPYFESDLFDQTREQRRREKQDPPEFPGWFSNRT